MLRASLVTALLAALALAACGDEEATDAASTQARQLAQQTRALQEDVSATARSLVADREANARRARAQLARQEDRALELAERARNRLPEGTSGQDSIVQANERLAAVISDLREYSGGADDAKLEQARRTLSASAEDLRDAAGDLLGKTPEDGRAALERAREELPEIPSP